MDGPQEDSSPPTLAVAIEANGLELTAYMGRFPTDELYDGPDLMRVVTGVPRPTWNGVHRARFAAEDADARIVEVLRFFRSRRLPFTWIIGPSTRPTDLGERLAAHGLTHDRDEIGMAVDLRKMNEGLPTPPGLTVERAVDEKTLRDCLRPQAVVHEMPESSVEAHLHRAKTLALGPNSLLRLYVGYLKGEPVAASMMFLGSGAAAGIYAVATLPEARGKGIGTAMTMRPLLEAQALGQLIGTLGATDMGLNVYRRLGFREYCKLAFYEWNGDWVQANR